MIRTTLTLGMFLLAAAIAHAAPTLTGAGVFPTNAAGAWVGLHLWNTEPDNFYWNLFFADGFPTGPLLNGPTNDLIRPALPLHPGTYTFGIFGERPLPGTGFDPGHAAINLYLNDATSPSLSALAATDAIGAISGLTGMGVPGPNAESVSAAPPNWTDGQYTVQLTGFTWNVNAPIPIDRANGFDAVNPLGSPDIYGTLTLTVIPEPISLAIIASCALVLRRRIERYTA